jgi:uncharacterized protein YcbK (DUF882 family)
MPKLVRVFVTAVLALSCTVVVAAYAASHVAPAPTPRFFFAGNGRLTLHHAHFNTTLDVRYRRPDGSFDEAALEQIRHFFRSREDGREGDISLRLIELLGFIETRFHPQRLTLLSGYRSPEFNEDIRAAGGKAAKASLHTEGLAADILPSGLDLRQLWLELRELRTGGAGYYRKGNFLHVDTGKPRFWEETTSRVDEDLSAGNARIFVRTDYDRYADLRGAVLSLHSVTAFPLAVATGATLVGPDGTTATARLAAAHGVEDGAACLQIPAYAEAYRLQVVDVHAPKERGPWRVVLNTCEPRIERTPESAESNPIELLER